MQILTATATLLLLFATTATTSATPAACNVKCDARTNRPVCGASGAARKTFANECLLEFAKCDDAALTLVASVSCEDAAAAAANTTPKTNHMRATIRSTGDACVDEMCTRELDWICGSDGTSYENPCKFRNAQCHNKALKQVKDGACK